MKLGLHSKRFQKAVRYSLTIFATSFFLPDIYVQARNTHFEHFLRDFLRRRNIYRYTGKVSIGNRSCVQIVQQDKTKTAFVSPPTASVYTVFNFATNKIMRYLYYNTITYNKENFQFCVSFK